MRVYMHILNIFDCRKEDTVMDCVHVYIHQHNIHFDIPIQTLTYKYEHIVLVLHTYIEQNLEG